MAFWNRRHEAYYALWERFRSVRARAPRLKPSAFAIFCDLSFRQRLSPQLDNLAAVENLLQSVWCHIAPRPTINRLPHFAVIKILLAPKPAGLKLFLSRISALSNSAAAPKQQELAIEFPVRPIAHEPVQGRPTSLGLVRA
jgi:hypothetical protein